MGGELFFHAPTVDATNDSGFRLVDLPASTPRLVQGDVVIPVSRKYGQYLALASFVQFTTSQSVPNQLTLVLGQDAQYLDHHAVFRPVAADRLVEKDDL